MVYELLIYNDRPFKYYTLYDFNFIKWLKYGTAARKGLYLAYRLVYQKNTSMKFLYDLTQTIDFFSLKMVENLVTFKRKEGRFYINHVKGKSFYLFKTYSNLLINKNHSKLVFSHSNIVDKFNFNIINNFKIKFYRVMLSFFFFSFFEKKKFYFFKFIVFS